MNMDGPYILHLSTAYVIEKVFLYPADYLIGEYELEAFNIFTQRLKYN